MTRSAAGLSRVEFSSSPPTFGATRNGLPVKTRPVGTRSRRASASAPQERRTAPASLAGSSSGLSASPCAWSSSSSARTASSRSDAVVASRPPRTACEPAKAWRWGASGPDAHLLGGEPVARQQFRDPRAGQPQQRPPEVLDGDERRPVARVPLPRVPEGVEQRVLDRVAEHHGFPLPVGELANGADDLGRGGAHGRFVHGGLDLADTAQDLGGHGGLVDKRASHLPVPPLRRCRFRPRASGSRVRSGGSTGWPPDAVAARPGLVRRWSWPGVPPASTGADAPRRAVSPARRPWGRCPRPPRRTSCWC